MKIDDRNAVNLSPAALDRSRSPEAAEAQQTANAERKGQAAASDRVALSELSARLKELAAGDREARIARLAAEFEAGRYEPDAGAVADALIAEEELRWDESGEA